MSPHADKIDAAKVGENMKRVDVVLVGIGGYGAAHLNVMRPAIEQGAMRLVGAVDPFAERAADWPDIQARGIPVWKDLEGLRTSGVKPALAVLASPIQFHCEQTCAALDMGMNVLCEKPAAATLDEVARMIAARDRAGKLAAIGYQWSFSTAMQKLKEDVQSGRYGRPKRLRTWVAWPRNAAYYGRNGWAGRIRDAAGRLVNDSPVNNATAHYLHNMLYVLGGDGPDSAARPLSVEAELYRANPIENFDAACLRAMTDCGTEILFFAAHCVDQSNTPTFIYEFERGTVDYGTRNGVLCGTLADGSVVDYGKPDDDAMQLKLQDTLESVGQGSRQTACGLEAASMHTRVIDALQRMPVRIFAADQCRTQANEQGVLLTYLPGLHEAMKTGFEQGRLFSEMGLPWAAPALKRATEK